MRFTTQNLAFKARIMLALFAKLDVLSELETLYHKVLLL